MLAEWPGNQCHCLSPTGNKVSNKLRLMLPAWISQHSAAALTVKSTAIPLSPAEPWIASNNRPRIGRYIRWAEWTRDGSFCPCISPQQKVTFVELEKPP